LKKHADTFEELNESQKLGIFNEVKAYFWDAVTCIHSFEERVDIKQLEFEILEQAKTWLYFWGKEPVKVRLIDEAECKKLMTERLAILRA